MLRLYKKVKEEEEERRGGGGKKNFLNEWKSNRKNFLTIMMLHTILYFFSYVKGETIQNVSV